MAKNNKGSMINSEIWIINDEGKKVKCEVLFTFESEETHKNYIVYTDNSLDTDGCTKVYASIYDPGDKDSELKPVENESDWLIIETVLEEIQDTVTGEDNNTVFIPKDTNFEEKEDFDDITKDAILTDGINADFSSNNFPEELLTYEDFVSFIEEKKESVNKKIDEKVLFWILDRLEIEKNIVHIDYLFNVLSENNFTDYMRYSDMGMSAYTNKNFVVAEEAFRRAMVYCNDEMLRVRYANNLAYLIRRKETRSPEKAASKEIVDLLKPGIVKRNTFSLINMALFWAINVGSNEEWKMADQLISFIDKSDVLDALMWWFDVGNNGDPEGLLVHFLLLRNGKIASTPFGDIKALFDKIKVKYISIPDKFNAIVTLFDTGN